MEPRYNLIFLLLILFFIFPIEFFVIGEGYGYGIKGFTYQYQITSQGVSLIPITYELEYIINGTIKGKTYLSIIYWITGTSLNMLGLTLYLLIYDLKKPNINRICAGFILLSTIFVILSSITQYGFLFSGPAGISILIGMPLLIGSLWYLNIIDKDMVKYQDSVKEIL